MCCTTKVHFRTAILHNLYKRLIPGIRYFKSSHVCRWHKLILFEHWYNDCFFKNNLENKTKFTLFHRIQDTNKLPIRLPVLKLNEYAIKRSSPIKFLRTAAEELLNRTDYINILENKPSKKPRSIIQIKAVS